MTPMQHWARRQMRTCKCGRKYVRPKSVYRGGEALGRYRSERKRLDLCPRCEKEMR